MSLCYSQLFDFSDNVSFDGKYSTFILLILNAAILCPIKGSLATGCFRPPSLAGLSLTFPMVLWYH